MQKIREEAVAALEKAASGMRKYYDEGRQNAPEYHIGDKVYLDGSHVSMDQPSRKLDDRQYRPFPIIAKVGERAYKLRLLPTWIHIHPVFNSSTPPSETTQTTTLTETNPPTPHNKQIRGGVQGRNCARL